VEYDMEKQLLINEGSLVNDVARPKYTSPEHLTGNRLEKEI